MKNVIVATAILIFAMTVMCLYAELNTEIREKRLLTDLAEEAAATAALFYDENAYGYGSIEQRRKPWRWKVSGLTALTKSQMQK